MSLRVSGASWITTPASRPVTIAAHASAAVPLRVAFPASPGDHPESVQFTASGRGGQAADVGADRARTLIPSSGGSFRP